MSVASSSPSAGQPPLLRTLVGLGVICGVLIAFTYSATAPLIQAKRERALQTAVLALWPAGKTTRAFQAVATGELVAANGGRPRDEIIHGVYDSAGRFLGVAIVATGMGYQDRIQLIYGYDPRRQMVTGMRVLDSRETPGLGDRIEYDAAFHRNFVGLPIAVDAMGSGAMRLQAVKAGSKRATGQIDTISGATVSSRAVVGIMNGSIERWAGRLQGDMEELEGGPQTH